MKLTQDLKFNQVVTGVFQQLMEAFPEPIDLDASAANFEVVGGWKTVEGPGGAGRHVDISPSDDEYFFRTLRPMAWT